MGDRVAGAVKLPGHRGVGHRQRRLRKARHGQREARRDPGRRR
jgi:hypothetical protein